MWVMGSFLLGLIVMCVLLSLCSRQRIQAAHRDYQLLKMQQFKVCIKCWYDLNAHENQGLCPECGRAYLIDELKASWQWTYREILKHTGDSASNHPKDPTA